MSRVPLNTALKNTLKRTERNVAVAILTIRYVSALERAFDRVIQLLMRIPAWVYTLAVGLMWLSMAVIGIGKGQEWAVFCAFLGMLWWALQEKNFADLLHDHARAIAGWSEAVNALENAAPQPVPCLNSDREAGSKTGGSQQAAVAATEKTPTDQQLDALFYHYRWFVQEKAPAPDQKTLYERQRAAWDTVFSK